MFFQTNMLFAIKLLNNYKTVNSQ